MSARNTQSRRWAVRLIVASLILPAACTTAVQRGPGAGVVAQLSVERFLQAANARDIESMGRLFGTVDGPVLDTGSTVGCAFKKIGSWFGGTPCAKRSEVEVRLDAIAQVLRHQDYRITREQPVAGRLQEATQVFVDLTIAGEVVADVPFVVVRTSGGRWLVEEVDLERVMTGPRRGNPRGFER
ncbi:MAG: hypothetical protein P8170_01820 [Gemmatimonadota bacterium]|jgi:hypothetical protein